jgi:tetratricopeptide (TPR) repeat protein
VRAVHWIFIAGILGYSLMIMPFSTYLYQRPAQIKLGYVPEAKAIKYGTADQRYLVADWAVMKVMFYFGELIEKARGKELFYSSPDYLGMFRTLQTALRVEPYNKDAYYFAQAAFTWELGRFKEVNNMLDFGMKYRTWDEQLPFFVGFNCAYFMKDYAKAAEYMRKAAVISKNELYTNLAARYFYEAGSTDLGIVFIESMIKSARNDEERKMYLIRRDALLAIQHLSLAVEQFKQKFGAIPESINELVARGILQNIPADPYGGSFYLDEKGVVRSTSKLAFMKGDVKQQEGKP